MRVELKSIDLSSEVGFGDLTFPAGAPFHVWLTLSIGPVDSAGADLFQLLVCNPDGLRVRLGQEPRVWGRHMLVIERFDHDRIRDAIRQMIATCAGPDWNAVGAQLSRHCAWEFEDYDPS